MDKKKIPYIGFEIEKNDKITEVRSSGKTHNYIPTSGIHRHKHHEILIIKKGGGSHFIDFKKINVVDNQIFFLRPGQVHQFLPNEHTEFYFVAIDSDEIQLNSVVKLSHFEFFQSFHTSGYEVFDEVDSLIIVAKKIRKLLLSDEKEANHHILISSYVVIFLIELQNKFLGLLKENNQQSNPTNLVVEFNKYMDNPSITKRFVKDYANMLFVSSNYLNEIIKKETKQPASFWINQKILLECKRLLTQSALSIKEISSQLEFSNAAHFNRFFKRHMDLTPLDFRKKYH